MRLIDIERVESLPGPQGTLFGSSSQAGTLHYVTNKPDISGYLERGRRPRSARPRAATRATTSAAGSTFPSPTTSRCAPSASGRKKAATSTTSSAPTLMGDRDECGHRRGRPEHLPDDGRPPCGPLDHQRDWNLLTTGIYQRGDTMGTWETDPFLGDNKVTRFYDEWRDDEWYTTSATLKGDLGFAELSLTASYFNRKIDYQFDNTNYAQWRTSTTVRLPRLRPLRHGHAALDDLQLPEAEPLGLRGPPDLAGRQQAAVDGGRLLRGCVRLVGIRRR